MERLNRGTKVPRSVLETCLRLENDLEVETVLMLRAKARRSVRSETASLFAAEDWLGWMLVGRSGGDCDDYGTGLVKENADLVCIYRKLVTIQ